MPRTRTTRSTAPTAGSATSAATTRTSPYFRSSKSPQQRQPGVSASPETVPAPAATPNPALAFGTTDPREIHYPTDPLERANATRPAEAVDAKGRRQPSKVSEFDFKVYDALLKVPKGKLTTYAALAKSIQAHPRAVGQALRRNPYAPLVPCHRVISSDFKLGGFNGATGQCPMTMRKYALLVEEGAIVAPQTAAKVSNDVKVQVVPDGMFDWSA
ncbi:6-O-methylguanine DNA methyltransferase [Catenaria anguillulae PL171]|uniref:Methylated-DNA--protein-cysteine methyltransferase n=1 Tax=Catenaria anguillulae PL171 TaxID=765915 RepID=A0A1Y2H6W7_9FUNG|nr:6-O-methylguanine DNA methyltransferase [Catenaria anguillulae PL171]